MKNILFVGAFKKDNTDGSTGGVLFACTSLIESELGNEYNFIKIDSTVSSVPVPPIWVRFIYAIFRLMKFLFNIIFKKVDGVLIFSSNSFSFIEKGLYVIIANVLFKKILFAPRSGLSLVDYKSSLFMRWYMKKVIRNATFILCQGKFWINFYSKMDPMNSSKFILMNNWIDPKLYGSVTYKNNNKNINLLYVGWLEEYKGVLDFLGALIILKKKYKNFVCRIYGNGSLKNKIKKIIRDNKLEKNVCLLGWANKEIKLNAYTKSDIFIIPSHFEGFPNSLIEAMSAQLPVIASNVGAMDDIIDDGIDGLIFKAKDINQLVKKLEILIIDKDLRMNLAINARKKVLRKFTIKEAVIKMRKIL